MNNICVLKTKTHKKRNINNLTIHLNTSLSFDLIIQDNQY